MMGYKQWKISIGTRSGEGRTNFWRPKETMETQSPNAPILQCSSEQNVREMETRSPNPMTRSSCTPQHNVQGLDTPSPNGVACYGHNPQQNVQGLVPLSIMGQTHPGYYINQQSMQGLNFGSIQNRE
ncbi:FRS (FAR1 Related Sequences) transcription factor family [Tripterygium wilfordii]|uniref:FRS (FAR1 Related Sequences) transcription factor family n=1 Tax=Tripterygium wilfordii TaxID=458696 RepID=A0A7J7DT49_TRIWF|nr:FRS (FAR1 Related Sequences) transcription factor family [Tripterygium wilfordii]